MPTVIPAGDFIILAVIAGLSAYLGSYLRERGKNLATKKDVGEITEKVEAVRSAFAADLEDRKASHQLRAACLDRRLLAHQEAYTLWLDLVRHVHNDDRNGKIHACQDWWDRNCLFLDEKPRKAFLAAFRMAGQHRDLVKSQSEVKVIHENWDAIIAAGSAIEAAVGLPAINEVIPDRPKAD